MQLGRLSRLRRSQIALIGLAGVLVVTASGGGLYLYLSRRQPQLVAASTPDPTASSTPAPSDPEIGTPTVRKASTAEVLSVVATNPIAGSRGAAPNTPIELSFNLPVDAAAAQSFFSVLPERPGTFSQGRTPQDVVFTPTGRFGRGSSVNVVLRKGYTSRDGYALQDDYSFTFRTALSRAQVVFQVGDQLARLHTVVAGGSVDVTLQFGDNVPPDTVLETYRATSSDLLNALVHKANGTYLDRPINTARMQFIASEEAVNGGSYTVSQPDGIYLLLASSSDSQHGAMWINFSKFGVILRQDDQKVVVAGQDLTTGSTAPTFDITFFDLLDDVKPVLSGSFSGTGQFEAPYPSRFELGVATSAGQDVIIPIGIAQTNADIKVVGDLSQQPQIYLTTDRPGYQQGDVVKFGGVVRMSNDQAYTVPSETTVAVWSGFGPRKPISESISVAANGTFHGRFTLPRSVFERSGTDTQLTIYAGTPDQEESGISPFATVIALLGDHEPNGGLTVSFDRSTYMASDEIIATVSGVDSAGEPLAGTRVRLMTYSAGRAFQPRELDSFAAPSTWGLPAGEPVRISLDADGQATYTFEADVAQKASDQEVTLVARYGSGVTEAVAAETAVVYQAAQEVYLLPSRTVYRPGDDVLVPFVVESLAGERSPGVAVTYEFAKTRYVGSRSRTTVVARGTVTTDPNGMGTVRAAYSGPRGEVILRIKGKDAAGNTFADAQQLTITDEPAAFASSGTADRLVQLSATPDKIAYAVGDTARLTITAPTALNVFMSLERGRIHRSKWISLEAGSNTVRFTVGRDLAPGFSVIFSYFQDGAYLSEGLPISVKNAERLLTVTLVPDEATYAAGQTARVTINVTDSTGAPVEADLLVAGYDANMSANRLVDQASMAGAFLVPSVRLTNGSSSLVGIGNWDGGRCGIFGSGYEQTATNAGESVVWLTDVAADADGTATVDVPMRQASVRLTVFAVTSNTLLGQAQIDLAVP